MTVGQLVESLSHPSSHPAPAASGATSITQGAQTSGDRSHGREDVSTARVVYLVGQEAQQLATEVNDVLVEAGVAPAVVGALQDR